MSAADDGPDAPAARVDPSPGIIAPVEPAGQNDTIELRDPVSGIRTYLDLRNKGPEERLKAIKDKISSHKKICQENIDVLNANVLGMHLKDEVRCAMQRGKDGCEAQRCEWIEGAAGVRGRCMHGGKQREAELLRLKTKEAPTEEDKEHIRRLEVIKRLHPQLESQLNELNRWRWKIPGRLSSVSISVSRTTQNFPSTRDPVHTNGNSAAERPRRPAEGVPANGAWSPLNPPRPRFTRRYDREQDRPAADEERQQAYDLEQLALYTSYRLIMNTVEALKRGKADIKRYIDELESFDPNIVGSLKVLVNEINKERVTATPGVRELGLVVLEMVEFVGGVDAAFANVSTIGDVAKLLSIKEWEVKKVSRLLDVRGSSGLRGVFDWTMGGSKQNTFPSEGVRYAKLYGGGYFRSFGAPPKRGPVRRGVGGRAIRPRRRRRRTV
jgi:hypothetical protein